MKYLEILRDTYDEMPNQFTSYYFKSTAIANGYPKDDAIKTKFYPFLRLRATLNKVKGKTWTKREEVEQLNLISNPDVLKFTEDVRVTHGDGLAQAIEIVKDAGYKVMKRVDDWIEL